MLSLFAALVLAAPPAEPLTLVCMDPLSKPLSCDCVRGYAQRDYALLGRHLEKQLGREVRVVWFESLGEALQETGGKADLIVGKHSVVLADAKTAGRSVVPVASLTGQDGSTEQTGVVVVKADDPAASLADLQGYRVFFGPTDAAEKSSAPEAALKAAGVRLTGERERFGACSEAAAALKELNGDGPAAAVISSYAEPLLEGCGSVKKGDLKVVGRTEPVPFVTAFAAADLDKATRAKAVAALMLVAEDADLMIGLETLGFVPFGETGFDDPTADASKKNAG